MEIPEYDHDPADNELNAAHLAEYDAEETMRVHDDVHSLFLLAERATTHELYRAMRQAFAPPVRRAR
jgi:hypothetical protein